MTRLLITTALEQSWPHDVPVAFLGEWCRLYSRRQRWSTMDAVVLPYHWDDRNKLRRDYGALRALYEELLDELGDCLNGVHRVSHSRRYWRILVGPWLDYFVGILFDRWEMVRTAAESGVVSEALRIPTVAGEMVPADMREFTQLMAGDAWNHAIFSRLMEGWTTIRQNDVQPSFTGHAAAEKVRTARGGGIKKQLSRIAASAFGLITREQDAFFLMTYLPAAEESRLQWKLGQIPKQWRPIAGSVARVDPARRQWRLGGNTRATDFGAIVRRLIPEQIPTAYLEGYRDLLATVRDVPWPRRPKVIWTSNSFLADEVFKAWAAEKVEMGSPLVIGQHGGHYGIGAFDSTEEHQIAISDAFLTWGWRDERPGVVPVGMLKRDRVARNGDRNGLAVMVLGLAPRFSYRLFAVPFAGQWESYFDGLYQFVEHLPASIQDQLLVRLAPADQGWNQRQRWKDRFPRIRLDDESKSMSPVVARSRICICTYNATTFLDSMSEEVPTVIFWNPRQWELRGNAVPDFERLKRVGIFHDTPQSAAGHVAAIWDDVNAWWTSPVVRDVREEFACRYCHRPSDMVAELRRAMDAVIETGAVGTGAK